MRARTLIFGLAPLFGAAASLGQPATFPNFVVNTGTAGEQNSPCAAIDDAGNSVVFWEEIGGAPFQTDVQGQLLAPNGAQTGSQFDVMLLPNASDQYQSDVAGDGTGKFTVVWTHESGGLDSEVLGRLWDGSGWHAQQFVVNTFTTGYQSHPSVSRNASGDFVVVWEHQPGISGQGDSTIQVQRFDASGTPVGPERRVNSTQGSYQNFLYNERPDVAMNDNGDVMIVWQYGNEILGYFGDLTDLSPPPPGTPPADLKLTSGSALSSAQNLPRVAANANGDFLVVWEGVTASSNGVFRRLVSNQGALGPEGRADVEPGAGAANPDVGAAGNDFVVAWRRGVGLKISARAYRPPHLVPGAVFHITQDCTHPTLYCPNYPRVAANPNGNVIVSWGENDGGSGVLASAGVHASRMELHAAGVLVPDPAPPASVRRPLASAGNGVIEPGETTAIRPTWNNTLPGTLTVTGAGSNLTGPAGGTYTLDDTTADYGSIAEGGSADCETATGNCYQTTISGSPRPATHWDASFLETLSNNLSKTWTLHLGESFTDVPTSQLFYRAIESVLHAGITTGCTGTTYCPGDKVTRAQMSLFLARGVAGGSAGIPNTGTIGVNPYTCGSGGTSLFPDVLPTDIFCRSVHYLGSQNVTSGCPGGGYCPTPNVTRLEMSAFVARAVVAPGGGAAVPLTYGPDPITARSYSCDQASPSTFFDDVPASNSFCKHAHFLWAKGIISGCGATAYCPNDPVTRDQMAKFLANGFGVQLYGP